MDTHDAIVIGAGQSGLAAARALREAGATPLVLEAAGQPGGSWPPYYDSLTLFSPARYSALPGLPFGCDPDRFPRRDEVTAYLRSYAARLDADIRTRSRVTAVTVGGPGYIARLTDGTKLGARAVVAATGSFGRPRRPALPGLTEFTGILIHAGEYRSPGPYTGRHVIVVGSGNSAVRSPPNSRTPPQRSPWPPASRSATPRSAHLAATCTSGLRSPDSTPCLLAGGSPSRQPSRSSTTAATAPPSRPAAPPADPCSPPSTAPP